MPRSFGTPSARARASRLRASWDDLCRTSEYRGRWVALDNVHYCPSTSKPIEGDVVDADDDLASLCQRMREGDHHSCCILLCEDTSPPPVSSRRRLH
jgi:hypothetical protein